MRYSTAGLVLLVGTIACESDAPLPPPLNTTPTITLSATPPDTTVSWYSTVVVPIELSWHNQDPNHVHYSVDSLPNNITLSLDSPVRVVDSTVIGEIDILIAHPDPGRYHLLVTAWSPTQSISIPFYLTVTCPDPHLC
jgi:hypothetical protein